MISLLSLSYSSIVGRSKWYLCKASGYVCVTLQWRSVLKCCTASPLMDKRLLAQNVEVQKG